MEENQVKIPEKVVLIGGSAGSLEVLLKILPKMEKIDTIAIVIVLHRKNSDDNILEELLRMKSGLHVKEIEDKTLLKPGRVHVAPADYHLLFEADLCFSLDISEKVNYSRPSIDITFESAAVIFGSKLNAILLSGANTDGTQGLTAVKQNHGIVIIQSPSTAEVPFMPAYAISNVDADYVLAPLEIATYINGLSP